MQRWDPSIALLDRHAEQVYEQQNVGKPFHIATDLHQWILEAKNETGPRAKKAKEFQRTLKNTIAKEKVDGMNRVPI
ncbi:hypothetical protein NDU88_005456 [Pleurodeles waltl]|uniref:Uncharacterized protein n=1 Tax=Pleurodeles waltl TaxID=8319 RepID=A0AAV7W9L3_PLEWA|nr:hypothetical protein NDU88_005456 [Pleurodeles waltl]